MDKPDIIKVLEDAKVAHESGDFVNALKFYQTFFDHALDDDPYALYGARLSHCLDGWAELALTYPAAKSALSNKRLSCKDLYMAEMNPEDFNDYYSICKCLGLDEEAIETFLTVFQSAPKSAEKLAKFVWDDLVNAEHWQECNALVTNPTDKLNELFAIFDQTNELKEYDPSFNTKQFDLHIVETLLSNLQKLVLVLRQNGRADDIKTLQEKFYLEVKTRNHPLLDQRSHSQSSFLFIGH